MYEEVPHVYTRKTVYIQVHGRKRRAVVYVMTVPLPGRPTRQYVQWLRKGYETNKIAFTVSAYQD